MINQASRQPSMASNIIMSHETIHIHRILGCGVKMTYLISKHPHLYGKQEYLNNEYNADS